MLILFKAPSLCTVLFLLPSFLSTTDEALLVDDFAPILVVLNRGKSQSSKVSTHLSPSVTARLVLDGRAVGEDGPPLLRQFPRGPGMPGFCGPSREKGLRNELLSITVLWVAPLLHPPAPSGSTKLVGNTRMS